MSTLKLGKHFLTRPTVLLRPGRTDRVSFTMMGPSPFPEMQYPATFTIDAREGYGVEWLKECFGIDDPEVIGGPKL